ncbi:hypothetical protein GGS23DRAFT_551237, partial [Durotheca rogersii]|uniref:uncharacterized protein n=1 Tax=Durotheca rogersii TaxID=419775 RepID=UPI0022205F47
MMTAQHHRRRSLEAARRRRNERRTSGEQLQDQQTPIPSVRDQASPEPAFSRSRASSSSLSASSSTSSSLVNVSRPSKFSFGAFFSGSGRKHHHRVKKKRSNRLSRYGNSSSSSVNSDLAYGRGYVDRRRSRELASRDGDGFGMAASPPPLQTDAEIVELGRKFAELARKQNTEDLRAAGRSRPSALVGAATALSQFHRTNSGKSRGVGSSKPRRDSSPEDSEWESASDDDSSSEEFDSGLAYGSGASLPSAAEKPTRLQRPRIQSPGTSESQTPLHRKRSFVDPNLFGPVNSLRGYVDAPCGFEPVDRSLIAAPSQPYEPSTAPSEITLSESRPLQQVYPVPTSDPGRFDAARGSVASFQQDRPTDAVRRPAPVPLQEPRPITPIPRKILDPVEAEPRPSERAPSRQVLKDTAVTGIAAAAIGLALSSDRKDGQDSRESPRDRDDKPRTNRLDVDARDASDEKHKSLDDWRHPEDPAKKGRASEREIRHRETIVSGPVYEDKRPGESRDGHDYFQERDGRKYGRKDEQKANRREIRRDEQHKEDSAQPVDAGGHKRVEGREKPPRERPIDPFQFQVTDDAFQPPVHATPRRPLTPNVITIDREPNFSPFKPEDDRPPFLERESRRDSYERELRDARRVHEETNHATAPLNAAPLASAAPVIVAEDRGRSHNRGTDSTSRNRSRRSESPTRGEDAVLADANRYYREAELARKAKEEEERRARESAEASVVDKWKEEPTIVDVAPRPETHYPKMTSLYDAPNADVRVDNILEHPNELSRFRVSDYRDLSETPIFQARDPSAERERPMLNIVRPTPTPTPTPRKQQSANEPPPEREEADIDISKAAPDVDPESQMEASPVPSMHKAVTWGKNQTKHYVVESPERGDNPDSGPKVITPATTPRSRSGRKIGWGFLAAALGATSRSGAAAPAVSKSTTDTKVVRTEHPPVDEEKSSSRRTSAEFEENTYENPPVPGPKPPSPRNTQTTGAFAEDPGFTATIAAALKDTGFNPDIVIDDANFHRRDSPHKPTVSVRDSSPRPTVSGRYRSPFAESMVDLGVVGTSGTVPAYNSQTHGSAIDEVSQAPELPAEEDIPSGKSPILSMLTREKSWGPEKAANTRASEDDIISDGVPRRIRGVESAETITTDEGEGASLHKKESKKSKKVVVVQENQWQPEIVEDPRAIVPIHASQDVEDAESAPLEDRQDVLNKGRGIPAGESDSYSPPPILASAPETSGEQPEKYITLGPISELDFEWEFPRRRTQASSQDPEAYGPRTRSAPVSELSMESSYNVVGADVLPVIEEEEPAPNSSEQGSEHDNRHDIPSRPTSASRSSSKDRKLTDPGSTSWAGDEWESKSKSSSVAADSSSYLTTISEVFEAQGRRATDDVSSTFADSIDDRGSLRGLKDVHGDSLTRDSPSRVEHPAGDLVQSRREMVGPLHDLRGEKTTTMEEEPSTLDSLERKAKPDSVVFEGSPSQPAPQSTAPPEASISNPKKHVSYADSPTKPTAISHNGTINSLGKSKKLKRRATLGGFPEDEGVADEKEPPDLVRDETEPLDRNAVSEKLDANRNEDPRRSGSRTRSYTLDDIKSTPSNVDGKDRKNAKSEKDKTSIFDRFRLSIVKQGEEKDRTRKPEEDKNSFLDNADTLGAGVGSAGSDAEHISRESHSSAINVPRKGDVQTTPITPERRPILPQEVELVDPEIVPREIRPAIDPRYGDLLPLPPSRPGSPVPEIGGDFPPLPDSRPETPEYDRIVREKPTHTRRRSTLDSPLRPKTPSQSAIPIQFRLGHRATPSSASSGRYSPVASPIDIHPEFGSGSRTRPRPTSWESSREFKPLLLLQKATRDVTDNLSFSDKGSPSSDKFGSASPHRPGARASDPELSYRSPASPDQDRETRSELSASLMPFTMMEPMGALGDARMVEVGFRPSNDNPLQPPYEFSRERSVETGNASYFSPPPENGGLPLDDGPASLTEQEAARSELPTQKSAENVGWSPQNYELIGPALITPNLDRSLGVPAAEASGDAVLQRPPNLAPAQHITDLAHTVEKFHGNTQIPSVSIGPADRDVLRPETEGLLASGAVPENETAELVDALNTTEEITQNNEPDDLSHPFPETTQGTGVVLEDRLNETGRLPEAPTNIGVPLVQDVATSNDTVSQQVAIDNQDSTDIEKTVSIKRDISIEQGPISQLDVSMAAPAPAVDPEFTNTEKAPSEPEALEVAVQPSSAEPEALEVIAEPPSAEAEFQRALFDSPLTTCEPTVVELETSTVEGGLASTEPAAQEVSIAEPEVATVEGRTSVAEIIPAVEIAPDVAMPETVMAEPELAPIEKEVAVPGKELLAVAPELITDFEIYAVEPSLVATPQEPAGVEERDPVVVGSEKSEEPTPAIESPSSTPKKDGEKSGQQLGLATPLGEPEKSGEDLIPECNNNLTNTDLQFSEPASLVQDQLEAAVSQDPPHVRSSLAEEAYSPSEKSKEENEAERIQSEDSEAKVDIGSAQTFIQEQESAPLSGDQPRRAVQEAETTVQIDNQLSVEAEIDIGEAIAPPPEIGPQLESLPGDQLMKTVSSEEPAQANTETNRDHQEISSGIPSTSETRAVNDDFFESVTPPSTGQGEQIHLAPEPLREEIQLPSDTMQPEETEASTVHEDLHVESQHSEVAPTLTEASSQNLVEQEANGSKGPEQTVVDEPILQPNIPGGESTPGPDHGSIGPRETPLSSTISTYNLQEWSAEKPGPAEEPMALDVGAGEGRLDLPSKPVAENPPELTYQEESADKKSEEEKQQSTSALAESDLAPIDPIATEIPRELIPQPTGLDASPEVSVPTNQQLIEPSVDKETGSADIEDGGENAQPSRIADTEKEPEQSKLEEPLAESPPSAEQLEPTSDILTEVDNSNKIPEESQASREIVNDSVVSDDQDQPLQSATELAEEPSAVIETDVDSKQPIEDLRSFTPSGADPVVGDQLTKGSTEVEASSSDRGATRDQNLDSHQVDPTLDGALQEAVGGSVTKDSTMDQETRRPEPTIDVGTISGGTQMHQPQEETDIVQPTLDKSEEGEKTGNQMLTDTKETLVFPIFAPEFSAEPGAISKEPPQIEKEGSGSGSTSTDTKRHETAQFAEPVEQTPMEMPTEPTGESSSLNTILSPDQESHEIPHQSDAQLELKDNPNNAPSDPDSSKQQPTGPSGPSTQSVETKKQRNGPVDEDTKPAPQDTDTSSLRRDSVSQNGTEISADASVGKPEGQLPAETLPKDDPDTTQQSSDEAVLIERQSTDDQARNETVNVGHPTVRDESLAPSDPKSEEAPPKEANAEDDRSKQRDLVDQPTSSDLHAKPPFPTHDLSPVTAEEEALIEVKKIKEDGKEHESGGQDSLDPTARTERPAEEPTQEPSIEVPPSDHVEPPPTAGRDLTEPDQTTSDVPMPAEPVQLPSQSQEEAPQSPLARKGKKDKKKKKKRASQAQETDTPAVPIEEPPIEQPQPHVHDVSHMPTEASSDLATIQETESQRPRATPTEELSDQPGPSTPDVSQIPTDTPDISTPAVQESEPQPFHAVEVVIPSRDDEREQVEPTTQTDKKENDVPIVEPATETSQGRESSVIGGLTGEEEARQTTNATEHSLLEEESAIGPPEPEEGHSEVVAVPKSKKNKKKKKKRNSQIAQDDVSSAPIQGAPESTSVIQAPIDEANSQEHANTVVGTEQVEADTSTLHQSPQDEDVEKPGPTHDVKAVDNTEVGDAKDQGPQDGQLPTEYTVAPPASDDTTAVALTQQEAIGQTSQEEAATLRPISPGAGALPEMQEMQETEHASEGPTHSEVQPDDAVQREESSKLDSSMQLRPSEAEEPRQAQETLQPEEPTEPAELPAAILGKPELVSPKKSKKKKKKRASQGGSVSMPKSTLPIEGSNSQTALPEQPSEQSYPDGPTQLSESAPEVMPGVEYSIASKDTGNAEDAPTEIRADEGSEQINRVSHIEPAIELETMAPSISCEQAEPPQEPIVERDVEQTSKHKGMESIPTEGADVPGDILPEVTSSEEPKERSQDESAAVLSTGPESEHTFKVEDNPAADEFTSIRMEQSTKLEPESAPEVPQPLTEPENIDSNTQDVKAGLGPVSLISEAETPTLTSVISAEPQPENMQPLTVEAEFPDHLDQGHAVDVSQNAGGHLAEPMDQEKSPIPDIERGLNASPQAETVAKYIIPDTIAGAVTETPQVPADHLIEFPVETSQEDEARAPSAPELSAQEGLDD